MPSPTPVYHLQTFSGYVPDALFHMTRMEELPSKYIGSTKPHSHTYYLLVWIKEGSGTHTIDGKTYSISPNQLYFLIPGKIHNWDLSDDCKGYNIFFDSDFCRGASGHLLYRYPFFQANKQHPLLQLTDQSSLFNDILDFIHSEYISNLSNRFEVILSALHIILELSDRRYHEVWGSNSSYLYDRIREYEQLIEHQFLTIREVSAYAAEMNLSPHYLNQICKKVVGKTASQIYQERLVLEAKFLLLYTTESIKQIGFRLGFQDTSYFVRFFRKNVGKTPVDFRQLTKDKR